MIPPPLWYYQVTFICLSIIQPALFIN
jgi:hypothetical protein